MSLADELKEIIQGEVEADEETLEHYSRDASLFKIRPRAVVFPKDVEDLKHLVRFVSEKKKESPEISLTARAGGTDMTGGPLTEQIVVDFTKYFNRVKEVVVSEDGRSGYAMVEPGVFYRDFEKETLKQGLIMPSFPASREICTVGGMVANNAGGEKTLKYGQIDDYIKEVKMVLSDGEEHVIQPLTKEEFDRKIIEEGIEGKIYSRIYNLIMDEGHAIRGSEPDVSKNSAGYNIWEVWDGKRLNLPRLIVGSQGTLGLITEVKLRLVKVESHTGMVVMFLKDIKKLGEVVNKVLEFNPAAFELFDDKAFKLIFRFFPSFIRTMGIKDFLLFALRFWPEVLILLRGGVPKLILLAQFEEEMPETVKKKIHNLKKELRRLKIQVRIEKRKGGIKKYLLMRRESFNLLYRKTKTRQAALFIDDIIIKPEYLSRFWPALSQVLKKYKLNYTVSGHIGDGNFHIIPLMKLGKEEERKKIKPLMDEVCDLTLQFGGSITAERNDGLIRSPYLRQMYGDEVYGVFEEIKNIFDPQNIFNPGKKVHSSLDYALAHIEER